MQNIQFGNQNTRKTIDLYMYNNIYLLEFFHTSKVILKYFNKCCINIILPN